MAFLLCVGLCGLRCYALSCQLRCQPLRRALYDFLVRMKLRMKFIELEVKTAFIVHGFDENNKEIIENIADEVFVKKLISIDRIQSISEEWLCCVIRGN